MLYIVRSWHDVIFSIAWLGYWTADLRASLADGVGYVVGRGDWAASRYPADTEAKAREAGDRICECAPDGAGPCTVRGVAAGAVAGGECSPPGDSRAHRLCATADSAEHVCGNQKCRSGVDRCFKCI